MIITALLWSSQALAGEGTTPAQSASVSKEIALGGIHAYLYYEPLGKMDERDLVSGRLALRNTITGEGDAEAPSRTTVVVVDVVGPSFASSTKGTLSMIASDQTHTLRRETVKLEQFFSEGPKLSIPFVIFGTGCSPLRIEVELAVKGKKSRLAKTVEYTCGE